MTLKFNKLKNISNWPTGSIFTGIVQHIAHFKSLKGWRSQVFTRWCGKIQTEFLFSKIAVFLMYREIYIYVFAIIKQAYIPYWHLYCVKKWNNIDSNSMLRCSAGFEWKHVVRFSQSHITWSTGNKMAAPIPRDIQRWRSAIFVCPHGMVQPKSMAMT